MATALGTVCLGPTEDFGNELRHVFDVVGRHVCEQRADERIVRNLGVKSGHEFPESIHASGPFIESWDWLIGHC